MFQVTNTHTLRVEVAQRQERHLNTARDWRQAKAARAAKAARPAAGTTSAAALGGRKVRPAAA